VKANEFARVTTPAPKKNAAAARPARRSWVRLVTEMVSDQIGSRFIGKLALLHWRTSAV